MAMTFRLATEADISALLKLRLAIDADQARASRPTLVDDHHEKSVAAGSNPRECSWRPVVDGLSVRCGWKRKTVAIDLKYFTPVSKAVYLHDVNVDPDLQRSGIGRQLLDAPSPLQKNGRGCDPRRRLRRRVGRCTFYKKCGFTEVGHAVYRSVPSSTSNSSSVSRATFRARSPRHGANRRGAVAVSRGLPRTLAERHERMQRPVARRRQFVANKPSARRRDRKGARTVREPRFCKRCIATSRARCSAISDRLAPI